MQYSTSPLIRSIEYLNLDEKVRSIVEDLCEKSDMPIVFWMDSENPRNTRSRLPGQINQYWITIQPNIDENEKNRLIVGGIYSAIQDKNRYWYVEPYTAYVQTLQHNGRQQDIKKIYELGALLNSLVFSLDIECFLEKYGIKTSDSILNKKFAYEKKALRKCIKHVKNSGGGICSYWNRTEEIFHIIEWGNLYRRKSAYKDELIPLITQIKKEYLEDVKYVAESIINMKELYAVEDGSRLVKELLDKLVNRFCLNEMFKICIPNFYKGEYPIGDLSVPIFSYVPDDWPMQKELISWIRTARFFICTYREIGKYNSPDVMINLLDTEISNSYADGTKETGYSISFSSGLVYEMCEFVAQWNISSTMKSFVSAIGEDEFRKSLLRLTIYFITAHEYAHIFHGDCDRSIKNDKILPEIGSKDKEKRADEFAYQAIQKIIPFEHRFAPIPKDELKQRLQSKGLEGFNKWYDSLTKERRAEIVREVEVHRRKCEKDSILLKEVSLLIEQWRLSK